MALLATASVAHGAECVDAKTAKTGFVLEKPGIRSEFRPAAGGMVSVANISECVIGYETIKPLAQ
ncbi:hypothetical protein ASD99_29145 [Mesorhizobium sp. Root695]|jgi:hypothetical protein|uniref:hypothetical protein n=1 Tax=unclassified Mesorhizobium TaxID=325217 RepID=UPI000701621B|nr:MULTISPECIES: hypothetical protein [unclassified Mesorhizobium]KQU79485.1 hypothetical protein ASD12_12585 [Mesorhizobium sp. Root102]KRB24313.1 hypothetical protein ASD99_29145 [Mesorhizobium sp. Root695]